MEALELPATPRPSFPNPLGEEPLAVDEVTPIPESTDEAGYATASLAGGMAERALQIDATVDGTAAP